MRSVLVAAAVGTVSIGVHLAGFGLLSLPSPSLPSGGGAPLAVALAAPAESFADLGAERLTPMQPKTARKVETQPARLVRTAPTEQRISPVSPAAKTRNSAPVIQRPVSEPEAARTLTPQESAPLPIAPTQPQRLVAQAPVRLGIAGPDTVRPKSRPAPTSRAQEPAQPTQTAPQRTARAAAPVRKEPAPKANPARTTAAAVSASPKSSQPGVARGAPSAFRNAVIRKISRTRKERAGARGQALVRFRVTDSGAVADLQVVRSSGSQVVDRVALRHIRRAGPFPPPPDGAQRRFDVVFKSPN